MVDESGEQEIGTREDAAGEDRGPQKSSLVRVVEYLKRRLKDGDTFRLRDLTYPEGVKSGTAVSTMHILKRASIFQNTGSSGVWKVAEGFETRSLGDTLGIYREQLSKEDRERREKKRSPCQVGTQVEEQGEPEAPVLELSEEEVVEVIGQLPIEYLVSSILQRVQREAEHREGIIKNLGTDKDDLTRQLAEKESEVAQVRQELVSSRTEVLQLRADLARAREVRPLSPIHLE